MPETRLALIDGGVSQTISGATSLGGLLAHLEEITGGADGLAADAVRHMASEASGARSPGAALATRVLNLTAATASSAAEAWHRSQRRAQVDARLADPDYGEDPDDAAFRREVLQRLGIDPATAPRISELGSRLAFAVLSCTAALRWADAPGPWMRKKLGLWTGRKVAPDVVKLMCEIGLVRSIDHVAVADQKVTCGVASVRVGLNGAAVEIPADSEDGNFPIDAIELVDSEPAEVLA